jgi:hypothetical protein
MRLRLDVNPLFNGRAERAETAKKSFFASSSTAPERTVLAPERGRPLRVQESTPDSLNLLPSPVGDFVERGSDGRPTGRLDACT